MGEFNNHEPRTTSGTRNQPYVKSQFDACVESVVTQNHMRLREELQMADESKAGPFATIEANAGTKSPTAKKRRSPRLQKAAAEQVRDSKGTAAKPRRYSDQEKNDKLKLIETQVAERKSTLKDAIKSAGISEQTYYQWKRAAKPVDQKDDKTRPAGDELADLVQLEKENSRLRQLLADKLRAENAELRKRLGLD